MDQSNKIVEDVGVSIRKRRTQTSRRPRPETHSPMSSAPISDEVNKVSSDDNNGDANSGAKMFNLNQCVSRSLPVNELSNIYVSNGANGDGTGSEKKLKKVKLRVGGVTRTIQAKSGLNGASGSGSSSKTNHSPDNARSRQRLNHQENSDEYHSPRLDKKTGLKGIPWKDFSKGGFAIGKDDKGKIQGKNSSEKQGEKSDSARKTKRAPKKRVLDEEFGEEDEDAELLYLEKLKTSKLTGYKDLEPESTKKRKGGKSRSGDNDYDDEEELLSENEGEEIQKKKQKKDLSELPTENKRELALTTRQRALLSKDAPSASGANQVEFPNGLPPAPSRKQKEKLTEVEQQAKKAEAAQRRRMQNEKAARESEAEAIRKILGQDSSRKKREEKQKKRQEELAQEKATSVEMLTSNTIRTIMGPTGTTVTFPQEMGFPKLFDPKPYSYPPPREKCAGPSCTNTYKYRDSKSKLPLCSLQCYKAVNEKMHTETAC